MSPQGHSHHGGKSVDRTVDTLGPCVSGNVGTRQNSVNIGSLPTFPPSSRPSPVTVALRVETERTLFSLPTVPGWPLSDWRVRFRDLNRSTVSIKGIYG